MIFGLWIMMTGGGIVGFILFRLIMEWIYDHGYVPHMLIILFSGVCSALLLAAAVNTP